MKLNSLVFIALVLFLTSCGGEKKKVEDSSFNMTVTDNDVKEKVKEVASSDFDELKPTLDNKGIGPIKSVTLGDAVDDAMAEKGKEVFKTNCTACHKFSKKYIGPALAGVLDRRSPEWVMNMILNSEEMIKSDPVAMGLIAKYNAPMAQQLISEEEARSILEYIRTKN